MMISHRNELSPPVFPDAWASSWGEDPYGLWQAFVYRNVRHAFRWIPPGVFMMGSPETEEERFDDEDLHEVTLSQGFWLGETTVTQALWQAVMGANPSEFKGDNRPVERVSWDDTQKFIGKLGDLHPDLKVRLPSEAEWEYACRAGTRTAFYFGAADTLTLARANYRGTWDFKADIWGEGAKKETADVKSYPCNPWGLYEMHGNVWEWCEDVWREPLDTASVRDPGWASTAQEPGSGRVLRGGSWINSGGRARSAGRSGNVPAFGNVNIGFRLALGHHAESSASHDGSVQSIA